LESWRKSTRALGRARSVETCAAGESDVRTRERSKTDMHWLSFRRQVVTSDCCECVRHSAFDGASTLCREYWRCPPVLPASPRSRGQARRYQTSAVEPQEATKGGKRAVRGEQATRARQVRLGGGQRGASGKKRSSVAREAKKRSPQEATLKVPAPAQKEGMQGVWGGKHLPASAHNEHM
jgi:hypothetical protein